MNQLAALALFCLAVGTGPLRAELITFSGFTDPNRTPVTRPYAEGDFFVAPVLGEWFQAQLFGNPVPSIFGISPVGVLTVTEATTGFFTFRGLDLADAGAGGASYTVEGFLEGVRVFSTSGVLPRGFTSVLSPDPEQTVDVLRITMNRNATSSYNADNISVSTSAIPEPAGLTLLGLGALGLLGYGRRRRRARRPKKRGREPVRPL